MKTELKGKNMPDIFWDGILPMKQIIFGQPDNEKLILGDNGSATFLTINPIKYMLPVLLAADVLCPLWRSVWLCHVWRL